MAAPNAMAFSGPKTTVAGNGFLDAGHSGHTADHDDVLDLILLQTGRREGLVHRIERLPHQRLDGLVELVLSDLDDNLAAVEGNDDRDFLPITKGELGLFHPLIEVVIEQRLSFRSGALMELPFHVVKHA